MDLYMAKLEVGREIVGYLSNMYFLFNISMEYDFMVAGSDDI